jgi:8-oxo-dGTP pyrophosphatase MutT (NUDIX family)
MVTIREAATVMLLRDAPELEVFMLRRHPGIFVGGASVFPGGAVDPDDRAPELLARCRDRDDRSASALLGLPSGGLGFWVAAIREAFEEAGVLLARSAAGDALELSGASVDRLEAARVALASGQRTFLDVVLAEDLVLDVGALHLFSHWITPAGAPRRYDTWFFVAAAPEGHTYRHDDVEAVASEWIRPGEALRRAEHGELELILPTQLSLAQLTRFRTTAAFLTAVQAATDAAAGEPRLLPIGNGAQLHLDDEVAV